jgi:hypothetical protein
LRSDGPAIKASACTHLRRDTEKHTVALAQLSGLPTWGHSVTLIGTAYNLAPIGTWFPPFIEAAIAASIFYMAIENIIGANVNQRWIITGLFGLVHGFGFADVLKEQLQFAGSNLLVSLLSTRSSLRLRAGACASLPRPHGRGEWNHPAPRTTGIPVPLPTTARLR